MAQAIYARTFSCAGKPTVPIGELIDVRDGTHDSPKTIKNGLPLVTSKHLLPYGVDLASANLISKADFDKINERSRVDRKDILISMIGTIGIISLVIERNVSFAIKNVGIFKTSQAKSWIYFTLCFLRSSEIKDHIDMRLAGSTQKYISLGELRKLPIVVPTSTELQKFNDSVKSLFEEIEANVNESARLAALRDALLPRLLSGEIL
jgi:type I restriction enzyme S subunit